MKSADAVIIGGGCMGTSTAYHLALLGCTDIVLLEGDALGSGSTGKSAGAFRVQHNDHLNTSLVHRSLPEFENFEAMTGSDIQFKKVGFLFLYDNDDDMNAFATAAEIPRQLGYSIDFLSPSQVLEIVPQLHVDDLVGASFCPQSGYMTPDAVVQGYAQAARALGATVRAGQQVISIDTDGDRVVGVTTTKETIATDTVVITAGVGSAQLAQMVGLDLPVVGEARTIFFSDQNAGIANDAPVTIDFGSGFYFHREGAGMIFAGRESDPEELSGPSMHRLPCIADIPIRSSWWGYYDVSPDHNALIGAASSTAGVYYATGFSGHGFMQSPAVGEHLAELITGKEPTLDLAELSADRISNGILRTERFVI